MTASAKHRGRRIPPPTTVARIVLVAALGTGACGGGDSDPETAPDRAPAPATSAADSAPSVPVDQAGDWSTETRTRRGSRPAAELVSARVAAHDGYDRLVLEFRDRLPGYTIGYVATELTQCGSGRPVDVDAPWALIIALSPAAAHDEGGTAIATRTLAPGLPVLRAARIICDFEGVVEWVVQVERRAPMRVLTLADPPRLVLDLRAGRGED